MMLPFGIFCAAVFAQPSITEIEEVIGLVHGTLVRDQAPVCLVDVRRLLFCGEFSILENLPWCSGLRSKALALQLAGRCE